MSEFQGDFVGEFGNAPRKSESLGRGSPRDRGSRLVSHLILSRPSFNFLYILYIRRVYTRFSLEPLFLFSTSVVLSCHLISSLCRRLHLAAMNPITTKPTYLNYRATSNTPAFPSGIPSGIRTSSPASSVSAPILNRLPSANSTIPTNPTGNSIILYVPNVASPTLSQHLSVLLSTLRVAAVHLIGRRDVVLKNLRTELYTLAGRMRSDVQVSITLTEGAKGLETAVRDIGARRQKVLGALVCEWDELPEQDEQEKDILTIDTDEIESMWKVTTSS
jgi:hypothetical protein